MDGLSDAALEDRPEVRVLGDDVAGERDGGFRHVRGQELRHDQHVARRLRPLQRQQARRVFLVLRKDPGWKRCHVEELVPTGCCREGPPSPCRPLKTAPIYGPTWAIKTVPPGWHYAVKPLLTLFLVYKVW